MIKIAITCIWKIDKRLDYVIDYVTNAEKLLMKTMGKETYKELHNFNEYGYNVSYNNFESFACLAQERACDRAQLEIEKVYVDDMIPDIYNNLINEGKNDIAEKVKPYVKKLRCGFPGYHCPGTCGHPRINREL